MLRSSISLGRWMGVELRVHLVFPVLLFGAVMWGVVWANSAMRGLGLFCGLVFAVAVREIVRALVAAYAGMKLRAVFLLPVGGVMAFAPGAILSPAAARAMTTLAPIANFAVAGLILGISYAAAPGVQLLTPPWISATHVLRSFVWLQVLIALMNMLPSAAMPTRQLKTAGKPAGAPANMAGAASGLLSLLAFAMIAAGLVTMNMWLVGLGVTALLLTQVYAATKTIGPEAGEAMLVRDVMLTDCVMLSTSDTLRGALDRTVHSLQDVFPVVRGDRLVGSVSRGTLAEQLQNEGDGFLQGVMTKNLQVAGPAESLVLALRRAAAQGASEFIPVVDDGRMLGILTPQSLGRAVQQVKGTRSADAVRSVD